MITEELKEQIITSMIWLDNCKGQEISIIDRISTVKENFDRHFTTTSNYLFVVEDFGVRTSGAIARIEGRNIVFQFRTYSVTSIEQKENQVQFDLNIKETIFRRIEIKKIKPVPNNV